MTEDRILDKVIKELMDIAFKDKVITDDEFELIQNIELNVEYYFIALKKAKEDGVITEKEKQELEKLKRDITTNANYVANMDGTIDDEELPILKKLMEIMLKYIQ